MTKILLVIGCAALLAACDDITRKSPLSPTAVVPVATAPWSPVFLEPYTQLIVGSTLQRKVDQSANPECYPGLGCQYFRITPDRDGMLDIELTWVLETQPDQGLDLTLEGSRGQLWASIFTGPKAYVRSAVKAGETSQITVWYTLRGLEFTLQTTLQPD